MFGRKLTPAMQQAAIVLVAIWVVAMLAMGVASTVSREAATAVVATWIVVHAVASVVMWRMRRAERSAGSGRPEAGRER